MIIGRRTFISGLAVVIAAPAIVRATSIMPVRTVIWPVRKGHIWYDSAAWNELRDLYGPPREPIPTEFTYNHHGNRVAVRL
jgi:hypothetical protein